MLEVREFERVSAKPVIRYWTKDKSMMISQAYNISENGILFNTGKEYDKDTAIYIQMRPPYSKDSIFFKAKIVHQSKKMEEGLYETGAEIVDFMDQNDRNLLKGYIEFTKSMVN